MKAKIPAPAKVNLFLETGIPEGGFHPLVSLVDIVDLCDTIHICKSVENSVSFLPDHGIPDDNTVTKAVSLMRQRYGLEGGFGIRVTKKIPPGSGLGGGSSDAACVLKALIPFCRNKPEGRDFEKSSASIGKDIPLFLAGRRCMVEGFGEKVSFVKESKPLSYLIMVPPFQVSTRVVYENLDRMGLSGDLTRAAGKIKIILASVESSDIPEIERNIENRLACSYFDLYPQAREVKKHVEDRIGKKVFVSGSGGSLFAVFATMKEAEANAGIAGMAGWRSFVVSSKKTSWDDPWKSLKPGFLLSEDLTAD